MPRRVAVLGAGASGLIAIKSCLDEGLEPVCFEKGTDIGGLWNYHEDIKSGHASVFRSTIINTSKEVMSFSDFPPPKEYPNFMHNTWVMKYFRLYADHFGLMKYITFKIHINCVKPSADYDATGKWDVEYTDKEKNTSKTETFDAVLVCTGHHVDPHVAKFPGQRDFQGRIVHTHDYKKSEGYEDKRIMVIGIGNSGGDAAVELARVGSQVFLSTRRGSWVFNRVGENGIPIDLLVSRRALALVPTSWKVSLAERTLNQRFNHANYGLRPNHGVFQQHPTLNDSLPNEILSGRVKVKANVKRFLRTSVEFEDGTVEEDIDEVVMATGYTFGFPFLGESIVKVTNNEVTMYKYVFPPHMKHGTLAVIGLVQPLGAINPISELQCRWATRVFKGLAKLPSQETMMADIENKKEAMALRYVKSQRHTIQVDFIPYMDEIAEMIGVRPNFYKLFLTDPKLAVKCFFGPNTPYQYRLMGPGKWAGAKEAIEKIWYRVIYATKTRPVDEPLKKSGISGFLKFLVFVAVVLALIMKLL
ncbi:flavin-containing monooxygenase 5-like isoform X2 [Ptychodera flava]|uniref:flavin-containing monooxygenase 5-like isoform X2 n=1 Tax=Ptychodera flava TaxID=63121 RepID=UPI00396A6133